MTNSIASLADTVLAEIGRAPVGGYVADGPAATEPTALAALALIGAGRAEQAQRALDWLNQNQKLGHDQKPGGHLGTTPRHDQAGWATSLAVMAWTAALTRGSDASPGSNRAREGDASQAERVDRAVRWILELRGEVLHDVEYLGHDTTLVGWPWVGGTHSWVEPTALHVLALKSAGLHQHPRVREGIRLLVDRQLPAGGCNVGNTVVLGRTLRAHVQPTGIALLALAGESIQDERIERSLNYLIRNVSERTTTASLCWALLALTAHDRRPQSADTWLAAAWQRSRRRRPLRDASLYHSSLVALAAQGGSSLLITLAQEDSA